MVYSYLAGGAVVNAFARQNHVQVHVVDVGVDHDFGEASGLLQQEGAARRAQHHAAKPP